MNRVADTNGTTVPLTDALGNSIGMTDGTGSLTTKYWCDPFGATTVGGSPSGIDPLNRVSSITYDLAGNPVSITDRLGQVTSNTFDGLGRKVFTGFGTTTGDSGPVYQSMISYQYDAGNRLMSASDSIAGTITRSYDGLNSIVSENGPQGNIAYGYDAIERRTSAQAGTQTAIQYTYDNASRLTAITQGSSAVGFNYDSANRRATLTLPNGVTVQYGYDQDSRFQSLTYTAVGGTSIGNLTYAYDAVGQRTEIGGSLAHTNFPNALTLATYDAANELTSWDGLVPVYDADGEMTTDVNGNQYTWDARNQLTAISGASNASFGYDAFGRRISKAIGMASVSFQYDGLNRVAETSGGATAWLLPGSLDVYFQRSDTTGTTVPLTDALGNTIGMTDGAGSLATTYWYDPFGATTVGGAPNNNSTEFAGRENDGNGLYYYRERYYNPQIGRFISEDPIGLDGGLDEYAYVTDNPLSFIDPLGMDRRGGFPGYAGYGPGHPGWPGFPGWGGGAGAGPSDPSNGTGDSGPNSGNNRPPVCGGTFGFGGYEADAAEGGAFSGGIWEQDSVEGSSVGSLNEAWVGGEIVDIGGGKITSLTDTSVLQGYLGFVGTGLSAGPLAGFQVGVVGGSGWGGVYVEGHVGPWATGTGGYLSDSCGGGS